MATYGGFEAVAELHRGGVGSVWSARRAGSTDDPTFAIKLCQPDPLVHGREAAASTLGLFLEQVEAQRQAAGAGSAWAPVHESGINSDVAFLVTDLFDRPSAERLVTGRFRLDSPGLHRIVATVVAGLRELERACGRAHGNLKPTNVMLSGRGPIGTWRIALADPASAARAASMGSAADLKALGDLIHQLVLHQPSRDVSGFPVPESRSWSALGPAGRSWLALCNTLLDPRPATPVTLDGVEEALGVLAKPSSRRRSPVALAGAAVALIAGGVGGYLLLRPPGPPPKDTIPVLWDDATAAEWRDLCEAWVWFRHLSAAVERGSPRRVEYAKDPDLAKAIERLDAARERGPIDPSALAKLSRPMDPLSLAASAPESVRTQGGVERMREMLEVIGGFYALLRGQWPLVDSLVAQAADFEGRGWTAAGGALRMLAKPIEPGAGVDAVGAFDRIFDAQAQVRSIDDRLGRLEAAATAMRDTGDVLLSRFPAWIDAAGLGGGSEDRGALRTLGDRLAEIEATGDRVREFLGTGWAGVDKEYLAEESPAYRDLASTPVRDEFDRWLQEARNPRYAVPPREDDPTSPQRNWRGETRLSQVREQVGRLRTELSTEPPAAVLSEVERLEREVGQVLAISWNRRNVEEKSRRAQIVQADLDRVWNDLSRQITEITIGRAESAEQARAQLREKREIVPNSDAINGVWVGWRDGFVSAITEANFNEIPTRAREVEEVLLRFNDRMAGQLAGLEASRAWNTRLAQVAAAEREARAARALDAHRGGPPEAVESLESSLERAADSYNAWAVSLERLATALNSVEDRLNAGFGLDEEVDGESIRNRMSALEADGLMSNAGVSDAVRPVTGRVAELRRIEGLESASELAAVLQASRADPESMIAAWRRLPSTGGGWPTSVAGLRQEQEFRRRIGLVIDLIGDRGRQDDLRREVGAQGPARWQRAFARAAVPQDVEAIAAMVGEFGADLASVSDSEPRLAYNLLASSLRQGTALRSGSPEPTDDAVIQAARTFLEGIARLPASVREDQKVAPLIADLELIVSGAEPPAPPFNPGVLGPGAVGWTGEKVGDSIEHLRYTMPAPSGPLTLEFRRLEPTDGVPEPVYLCTTEVSVAVLAGILNASGVSAEFAQVNPVREIKGPVVWTLSGGRILPSSSWLPDQAARLAGRYRDMAADLGPLLWPKGVTPDQPGLSHPVQQISPGAALLVSRLIGCRLPTSAEWRAAQATMSGVPMEAWNLRDTTWGEQRDNVTTSVARLRAIPGQVDFNVLVWPDDGIFWPADVRDRPADERATVRRMTDPHLWFAPVGSAQSVPFAHLIGNVAEFVFEDAAGADGLVDLSAASVSQFVTSNASRVAVIGGSALSPPEIPLDAPQTMDQFDVADGYGFADVGFRPAFSASGTSARETYAARVARLLTDDPYLRTN